MGETIEAPNAAGTPSLHWLQTVSPEARQALSHRPAPGSRSCDTRPLGHARAAALCVQETVSARQLARYPVEISGDMIAGVPVRIFAPRNDTQADTKRLLINLHGGGFTVDSGSLSENIPIAFLARTRVVAILYPLAPEHPFPAAVDAAIAVYREMLQTHCPEDIGLYGTSAGAVLTGQAAVGLKALGLPMPAALGFFSGSADLSRRGCSECDPSIPGAGHDMEQAIAGYAGGRDRAHPMISPLFSDLRGLPPTLAIAGTRDLLLSQTSIFHRALLRAGVAAELVVFEGMPHAHWSYLDIPESDEAFQIMAGFFSRHLGRRC